MTTQLIVKLENLAQKLAAISKELSEEKISEINIIYQEILLIHTEETDKQCRDQLVMLSAEVDRLKKLVFVDELTQIYNRRGFFSTYNNFFDEIYKTRNYKDLKRLHEDIKDKNLSIIFIDLDNFKSINDTYGHDIGDQVLKATASLLKKHVRGHDGCGRLGGEEFVVALLGASEKEAFKKAEEILKIIREEVKIEKDLERIITASLGVASLDKSDANTLDELVGYADNAMYEAKNNRGKNTVVSYSELPKNK